MNDMTRKEMLGWAGGLAAAALIPDGLRAATRRTALEPGHGGPTATQEGFPRIRDRAAPPAAPPTTADELPRLGLECVTPEGCTSPIITFTTRDGAEVGRRLRRAGVDVRVTDRWVRFSPSVYNDVADAERVLEALS